jgi:cytochrome c oxidase cbb3-type subunit 2
MSRLGVPYTQAEIDHASDDLEAQADPFDARGTALKQRYGQKIAVRDFDGQPERVTDMDALIAYLQMLGTLVDFRTYHAENPENQR